MIIVSAQVLSVLTMALWTSGLWTLWGADGDIGDALSGGGTGGAVDAVGTGAQ